MYAEKISLIAGFETVAGGRNQCHRTSLSFNEAWIVDLEQEAVRDKDEVTHDRPCLTARSDNVVAKVEWPALAKTPDENIARYPVRTLW